jgi:hypothetical protein
LFLTPLQIIHQKGKKKYLVSGNPFLSEKICFNIFWQEKERQILKEPEGSQPFYFTIGNKLIYAYFSFQILIVFIDHKSNSDANLFIF